MHIIYVYMFFYTYISLSVSFSFGRYANIMIPYSSYEMAIVAYTSNIPHNGIGNYSRMHTKHSHFSVPSVSGATRALSIFCGFRLVFLRVYVEQKQMLLHTFSVVLLVF